jgi:hypothetical protein
VGRISKIPERAHGGGGEEREHHRALRGIDFDSAASALKLAGLSSVAPCLPQAGHIHGGLIRTQGTGQFEWCWGDGVIKTSKSEVID